MALFAVNFEGYLITEASDAAEAERIVFDKLNEILSPSCGGGSSGDWEIIDGTTEETE